MSAWPTGRSLHGGVDHIPLPAIGDAPSGVDGSPGSAAASPDGSGGGGLWLCGKHFIGPDPEAALRAVGATVVVCLNEPAELTDRYPDYVAWLRANQPERALWWPIPDLHAPGVDEAIDLVDQLRLRLAAGQTLLVHCGAGIGRAGTVAAALLISLGCSPGEAIAHVAAHRPMAGPEAGTQSRLLQDSSARYRTDLG